MIINIIKYVPREDEIAFPHTLLEVFTYVDLGLGGKLHALME